ncbi:ABC transporter permease [Saccharopolyspora sp. NPDC000995]
MGGLLRRVPGMKLALLLIRRVVAAVLSLVALSALVFAATDLLPGDAADTLAGAQASQGDRDQLRTQLGLDRNALDRYTSWLSHAATGDLGTGLVGGRPVAAVLGERLPNSLVLTALALLMAVPPAIAGGLLAGMRAQRRSDRVISGGALVLAGLPEFLTVVALTAVLSTWLDLLPEVSLAPVGGRPWDSPQVLVLPALSLTLVGVATATRLVRSAVVDVLDAPYVESARLAGVSGGRLAVRHVLPNALGPAVQAVAVMFGGLTGGALVVEAIFNYPGVGYELQQAVANRDVPMVQGLSLALCATALVALLVGDVVATLLDPRRRGL